METAPEESLIGPNIGFNSYLNYVAIYNRSVKKLLNDQPLPPGIHYHLGILQVSLAIESLLNKIYLELIFPKMDGPSHENIKRLSSEARWQLAPILIQTLRGGPPKYFDISKMPYQGVRELIKFRNATAHPVPDLEFSGKRERPFHTESDLPRRTFWKRQEWPLLKIHKHPECVARAELERAYKIFISLIKELEELTNNLVNFKWATKSTYRVHTIAGGGKVTDDLTVPYYTQPER